MEADHPLKLDEEALLLRIIAGDVNEVVDAEKETERNDDLFSKSKELERIDAVLKQCIDEAWTRLKRVCTTENAAVRTFLLQGGSFVEPVCCGQRKDDDDYDKFAFDSHNQTVERRFREVRKREGAAQRMSASDVRLHLILPCWREAAAKNLV